MTEAVIPSDEMREIRNAMYLSGSMEPFRRALKSRGISHDPNNTIHTEFDEDGNLHACNGVVLGWSEKFEERRDAKK